MTDYALLLLPSANRVYADAAVDLTVAELAAFNASVLGGRLASIEPATIAGVAYVTFSAPSLSERDAAFLANVSARYALFERSAEEVRDPRNEDRIGVRGTVELLRPVPLHGLDRFDDDLVTIPKYPGKTNEQFTKLLLNVTVLASDSAERMLDARLRVLDPLCGRGTTLNQALTYGYDAAGVDLDGKDFEAYAGYIQTYLKRKRLKHKADLGPVRREKRTVARRLTISLAASRADHAAGDVLHLDVVHADTTAAGEFFRPETFDVIVTDAPYGVQHGSRTVAAGLRRAPLDLLRDAAPGWARLLRPGGALGLAWNTHVASREDAATRLAEAGLTVLAEPYDRFRHRVDQAITRDILVARKEGPLINGIR
jgi:SAM-dependent methyltransferase